MTETDVNHTPLSARLRAQNGELGEYSASADGVHFATGAFDEVAEAVLHHAETILGGRLTENFPSLAAEAAACITRIRSCAEDGAMQVGADDGGWMAWVPQPGRSVPVRVWQR